MGWDEEEVLRKAPPVTDEWRSAPSKKKDKKRFCGGNERRGVHDPVVEVGKGYSALTKCGVRSWWPEHYFCKHQSVCSKCGKILEFALPKSSCPDALVAQK